MKTKLFFACAVFMAVVFASSVVFAAAQTGTLTIENGQGRANTEVSLPVVFTGTADVGGVAFTLTFDPEKFEFVKLEQADPQVLSDPNADGYCSGETCVNPYDTLDTSALFFMASPDSTSGKVMIAAASAEAITNSTIFNAKFKIKEGVAAGTYTDAVVVSKSVISNEAAGYSAEGEEIDVLVGMPDNGDTFTTDLDSADIEVITGCAKGDANCDGNIDPMDAAYVLQYYVGNIGIDQLQGDCDTSGDGNVDPMDAAYILQYYVGNITEFE